MTARRNQDAFSLVEVTLAIGVIAFAMLAIIGLVPVGQQAAREAIDDTKASLIEQDMFERVRAAAASSATFITPTTIYPDPPAGPNYYYTSDGTFFSDRNGFAAATNKAQQNNWPLATYGATIVIGNGFANPLPNISGTSLKPVTVSLGYPIDTNGKVVGATVNGVQPNSARKTFTFYVRKP